MNETRNGKCVAAQMLKEYKLSKASLDDLVYIATQNGYEIIDYGKGESVDSVSFLAGRLAIRPYMLSGAAFTYRENDNRLIFLCESMTEEEKRYALAHELGHILCHHMSTYAPTMTNVREEQEANAFAHYVLNPPLGTRLSIFARKNKIWLTVAALLLLVASVGAVVYVSKMQEKYYPAEYYVTPSGEKYHKKDCFFIRDKEHIQRLTKDDMHEQTYEPCQVCLPE